MADYIAAVAELDFGQTVGIPAQNTGDRETETETETEAGRKTGGEVTREGRGEREEERKRSY